MGSLKERIRRVIVICGISGFVGVKHPKTRYKLVSALGEGIDARGGHAAGYVNYTGEKVNVGRKLGYWSDAQRSFIERASRAKLSMMHARYATCGKGEITEAHPFAIKRRGRIVLWGAHNGMIYNAKQSAKKNNRKIVVDSEEIFHLIADEDWEGIKKLEGYGVITWIYASDPTSIYLLRLSRSGQIYVVETNKGNIVYGSTRAIVDDAIEHAGLEFAYVYDVNVGTVYRMNQNTFWETTINDIVLKPKRERRRRFACNRFAYSPSYLSGTPDSLDNWIALWKASEEDFRAREEEVLDTDFVENASLNSESEYTIHCENCGVAISDEEESELEMLYEELLKKMNLDELVCKKCLGF